MCIKIDLTESSVLYTAILYGFTLMVCMGSGGVKGVGGGKPEDLTTWVVFLYSSLWAWRRRIGNYSDLCTSRESISKRKDPARTRSFLEKHFTWCISTCVPQVIAVTVWGVECGESERAHVCTATGGGQVFGAVCDHVCLCVCVCENKLGRRLNSQHGRLFNVNDGCQEMPSPWQQEAIYFAQAWIWIWGGAD